MRKNIVAAEHTATAIARSLSASFVLAGLLNGAVECCAEGRDVMSEQIVIESYNPYELLYPGLRVISREELHLIKMLREAGIDVSVAGPQECPLYYVAKKGFRDFLSDPINAFIVSNMSAFAINLVTNWISDVLKRKSPSGVKEDAIGQGCNIIISYDENGRTVRYSHAGEPISDERFTALISLLEDRQRDYGVTRLLTQSPYPDSPHPMLLEHQPRIVGWANLEHDKTGLNVTNGRIIDPDVRERVESGELRGFSLGIIVKKGICGVCDGDYAGCNHIAGQSYNGRKCSVRIDQLLIGDISIVKEPVNPLCLIDSPALSKPTATTQSKKKKRRRR